MASKFKTLLWLVAHTLLAFAASLVAGFTFYALLRPIIGLQRYNELAKSSPVMIALLLIVVALWGLVLYDRWHDRRAFFAWVLPALWICHLILSRGWSALEGTWADRLFFLEIGAAYSAGAAVGAIVLRKTSSNPPGDSESAG